MLGRSRQHLRRWSRCVDAGPRDFAVLALEGLEEAPVQPVRCVPPPPESSPSLPSPLKRRGRPVDTQKLWRKFFADPSQWSDVRAQKVNSKQPDWVHVKTKVRLWMKSASTPPWVRKKLAALSQAESKTLNNEGVQSLQAEAVTMKPMEIQSRARRRRAVAVSDGDIRELCLTGKPRNALHTLEQRGLIPSAYAYVCLLRRSGSLQDITEGKHVHAHMRKTGFVSSTFVLNALLNMYMKCGSVLDAREVFENMRERDGFTWTMMLAGYSKLGHPEEAFEIYEQMLRARVAVDRVTFTTVLSACASLRSLEKGKRVHTDMIQAGIRPDRILANTLIDMYAKCGDLRQSQKVFSEMADRDVVTWNIMISGAAQHGGFDDALTFLQAMRGAGVKPDKATYVSLLSACSSLQQGRALHSEIIAAGFELDIRVGTALLNMLSRFGSLEAALDLFGSLPHRNVVSWTSVIAACAQSGEAEKALEFYEKMVAEGVAPDKLTYTTVLRVCATLGDLEKGEELHNRIVNSGTPSDLIMESTLIDMYAKCGAVKDAHHLLRNMNKRDVVSYTSVISGYAEQGQFQEALEVFQNMQREGVLPSTGTFLGVVKACAGLRSYAEGTRIHASIFDARLTGEANLRDALADMYARCDGCGDAQEVSTT